VIQNSIPIITPGYRLQEEKDHVVLLYPEGLIELNQSGAAILQHCNGHHSITDIVAKIEQLYPGADIKADVIEFLEIAHEKGWVQFI
jgi:pyrroloquinoline quinone biosynthesis protein D